MLKLGSLFDGIGGWLIAAKRNGVEPVWSSEIEDFPMKVSHAHFPDVVQLGDVTKIDGSKVAPVDIICAGSPCQDLSMAGMHKGLVGERSRLFFESVRIVREMREKTHGIYPRYFVWENVPGAFSSNHGHDFQAVLKEISEANIPMPQSGRWAKAGMVRSGRMGIAWRTLDAQYWGVPQRRKRIFLVAGFGKWGGRAQVLFEEGGMHGNFAKSEEAQNNTPNRFRTSSDYAGIGQEIVTYSRLSYQAVSKDEIGACLRASGGVNGGGSENLVMEEGTAVRKLTPLECERLQGLPDNWTLVEGGSDSFRYKAIGNGMAQPCADFVMSRVVEALNGKEE